MDAKTNEILEQIRNRMEGSLDEAKVPVAQSMIRDAINRLGADIKKRASKWGGQAVKVTPTAAGVEVMLWMDLDKEDALETARIVLGRRFTMNPHKLKAGRQVAKAVYTLAELA